MASASSGRANLTWTTSTPLLLLLEHALRWACPRSHRCGWGSPGHPDQVDSSCRRTRAPHELSSGEGTPTSGSPLDSSIARKLEARLPVVRDECRKWAGCDARAGVPKAFGA